MKVEDPKKRRRLADQVARGELTLVKLREQIEGRRPRPGARGRGRPAGRGTGRRHRRRQRRRRGLGRRHRTAEPIRDDSLVNAKQQLAEAVEDLLDVLRNPEVLRAIGPVDRANLAKYLTIAKLRLENAIAIVRTGDVDR